MLEEQTVPQQAHNLIEGIGKNYKNNNHKCPETRHKVGEKPLGSGWWRGYRKTQL